MKLDFEIEGNTVTLRTIELEDAQRCVDWLADPNITRYMTTGAQTLESERAWIEGVLASDEDLVSAICIREPGGALRHVGNCGLHHIDRVNGHAELGIFIGNSSMHGRGIGQDAILTVISYAFVKLGLFKVWAKVYSPNWASRIMCERAGLLQEGILCGHRVLPEGRVNVHLFAAFKPELNYRRPMTRV